MQILDKRTSILVFAVLFVWVVSCGDKVDSEDDTSTDGVEDVQETDAADTPFDDNGDSGDELADVPEDGQPGDTPVDRDTEIEDDDAFADIEEEDAMVEEVVEDVPEEDVVEDVPEEDVVEDVPEEEVVEDVPEEEVVEDVPEEEIITGVCGDGTLNPGEVCDDGNTVNEACDTMDPDACLGDCSLLMADCGDGDIDPGEQCDDGDIDSMNACTTSCTINNQNIGDPCRCTGGDCSDLDFTAGTIIGCDNVAPLADSSRTLACLRSMQNETYGIEIYAAEGTCSLMALGCEGWFCGMVPTTGNVDTFSCPAGYAVTTMVKRVMGMTITTKSCHYICTSQADCRWNAIEGVDSPWFGECGQNACLLAGDGGEYICGDIRNAP